MTTRPQQQTILTPNLPWPLTASNTARLPGPLGANTILPVMDKLCHEGQTSQYMYLNTTTSLHTHTPLLFCKRDLIPPFTYTDNDDYIILFYLLPLTIVFHLMMAN